jgi:seryl-tRNA synthetase
VFQINSIIQEVTTQLDTIADTMTSRFEVIEEITTDNIADMTTTMNKEINGMNNRIEKLKQTQDQLQKQLHDTVNKDHTTPSSQTKYDLLMQKLTRLEADMEAREETVMNLQKEMKQVKANNPGT